MNWTSQDDQRVSSDADLVACSRADLGDVELLTKLLETHPALILSA